MLQNISKETLCWPSYALLPSLTADHWLAYHITLSNWLQAGKFGLYSQEEHRSFSCHHIW